MANTNNGNQYLIETSMIHLDRVRDPPSGRDPQFGKRCPRAVIYSSGFQSRSSEAQDTSIQPDIDEKDDGRRRSLSTPSVLHY